MFYLLFHCKGIGETDKEWREFNTEKGLLEFVTDNFKAGGFKVHKILKEVEEYELKYTLHLQPAKRATARKVTKEKPEEEKPDDSVAVPEEAERKCSVCGTGIKSWSKTGKCTSCQQGKKTAKK